VVRLSSAKAVATIPTGERPYAVAFANGRGFVTNQYGATLSVLDAESPAATHEPDMPEDPRAFGTFIGQAAPRDPVHPAAGFSPLP
jgi:hypothetical protein